jgi:hypothetical protein
MQRTIIVTDFTRFTKKDIVCTAGIDPKDGQCIRPMPYLQSSECKRLKILPGALLSSDFKPSANRSGPHQEDCKYGPLTFLGPCTGALFRQVLQGSTFPSVEAGFEIELPPDQKFLPVGHRVQRSIITIAVAPNDVEIIEDRYKPGKIKIHFRDQSGRSFRYIGVTDLGFHDYALQHHEADELAAVNQLLQSQEQVFLRIGLSRDYKSPDGRQGYWLQANGIYTFPHCHEKIRSYTP